MTWIFVTLHFNPFISRRQAVVKPQGNLFLVLDVYLGRHLFHGNVHYNMVNYYELHSDVLKCRKLFQKLLDTKWKCHYLLPQARNGVWIGNQEFSKFLWQLKMVGINILEKYWHILVDPAWKHAFDVLLIFSSVPPGSGHRVKSLFRPFLWSLPPFDCWPLSFWRPHHL